MLTDYLCAGFPALALLTQEPSRATRRIRETTPETWRIYAWDCLSGTRDLRTDMHISDSPDPVEAIRMLDGHHNSILIAHNLHLFVDSPEVIQVVQNGSERWKALGSCLVMLGPVFPVRHELEKIFTVLTLPLPAQDELLELQTELATSTGVNIDIKAVEAARGLTEAEAEAAFAMCLVRENGFSPKVVADLKSGMLKKSGLLEAWEPADIGEVGGLEGLKSFVRNRSVSLQDQTSTLPRMKSLLLVGVPGCGKSLTCKAVASMLGWPLLRLDLGNMKGSLVGESERRMREAIGIIEAFGQAVVFVDELEKGFAGANGNGTQDGGVMASLCGTWLTWMQETRAPVLIMATANGVKDLPPEMLRAGRWDGLFFVDLPTLSERREIISIMNRRYGTDIPPDMAQKLEGYSGAEIEQLVKDSLFEGWDGAYSALVPLSRTMRENLQGLRDWARARARMASTPEATATGRQIRP